MGKCKYRSWFKKALGPLLWLAGLAMIVYYAPSSYRILDLAEGEHVVGFRGKSHEMVTVSGNLTPYPSHRVLRESLKRVDHTAEVVADVSTQNVPLGDSINLLDLDSGARRKLNLQPPLPIYGLATCCDCDRFCIECSADETLRREPHCTAAVVEAQSGKLIRIVHGTMLGGTSISDDGKKLAYTQGHDAGQRLICIDVDTGAALYQSAAGDGWGLVSPDGQCLALLKQGPGSGAVIDLNRHVDISAQPIPHAFLSRYYGQLDFLLLEQGRMLLCAARGSSGMTIKWQDKEKNRDLPERDLRMPEEYGSLETVDPDADLIHLEAKGFQDELNWKQKVLEWLGFKQTPTGEEFRRWLLLDGHSGAIVLQGRDYLHAVSQDGQYVVSGDLNGSRLKVQDLPRRSLPFIAIAGGAWTALTVMERRWWRRGQRIWEPHDTATGSTAGNAVEKVTSAAPLAPSLGSTT
jgi:hypothetical protein